MDDPGGPVRAGWANPEERAELVQAGGRRAVGARADDGVARAAVGFGEMGEASVGVEVQLVEHESGRDVGGGGGGEHAVDDEGGEGRGAEAGHDDEEVDVGGEQPATVVVVAAAEDIAPGEPFDDAQGGASRKLICFPEVGRS